MLAFLIHAITAWDDKSPVYTLKQTSSGTNVYVSNSLFNSITSTSNGSAMSYTFAMFLFVESTSFISCKTSGQYGGAIYFVNTDSGECVLNEVCGYDCNCINTNGFSYGQFTYIQVNNAATSKNYVNYSSITRCVNENSRSHNMMWHHYGRICYPSVNISMNKCFCRTGILCYPTIDLNYVTCSVTYSSFADNNAIGHTCIYLWNDGANFEIKSCNILRNTQGYRDSEGTILTHGNVIIEESCILGNIATYIFFQTSSYTITLSNCTVDLTSNNGYLTTQSSVVKSFVLGLNHISTGNCHAKYDAVGALTLIVKHLPSSNKQKYCYTCKRSIYQYQLRYVVSLICVFIFNIIHQDASGYLCY
jgi:hypothetical protein